ncbi:hypothetical protein [Kiloniella sp. b19]|uniref:hypothetical protein n=1 Tax=Kiloniella sp. GXU_MW_B19 TaxID=3141326 RepID=UPI0031CDAEB3
MTEENQTSETNRPLFDEDVYRNFEGTNAKSFQKATRDVDHEKRIKEKDEEGEADLRDRVRAAQRLAISSIGWAVWLLVIGAAFAGFLLILRYTYLIWDQAHTISFLLGRIIEWFIVAGAAMFAKSRLFDMNKKAGE